MKELKKIIDEHREFWAEVAKKNNWYVEPFYVQIWVDKSGDVIDSVSYIGLDRDIVIKD